MSHYELLAKAHGQEEILFNVLKKDYIAFRSSSMKNDQKLLIQQIHRFNENLGN
jgi:hypothetical protein